MRLIGQNDLLLLAGLVVALSVVFLGPIADLLDFVGDLEDSTGLQLLPGLVVLGGAYAFHRQLRKRREIRAVARTAEADARQAHARADEMERLVAFGQALASSIDSDSLRATIVEQLPLLVPDHSWWVLLRVGGEWQGMDDVGTGLDTKAHHAAADRAVGLSPVDAGNDDQVCFPMILGGTPVGVLGVSARPPLDDLRRRTLDAAAALLAVSIKNAELFREIHEHSVRDTLTGCFNRRHSRQILDAELRRAKRTKMPLSLIMFDIDRFKRVNDQHGHLGGDAVLAALGHRMIEVLRNSDIKCRYGGDEFFMLLPDTPLAGAERVAEGLRVSLESTPVSWNGSLISVRASFGVASAEPGEIDADALIGRADAALYLAKQAGRNCVRTAPTQIPVG